MIIFAGGLQLVAGVQTTRRLLSADWKIKGKRHKEPSGRWRFPLWIVATLTIAVFVLFVVFKKNNNCTLEELTNGRNSEKKRLDYLAAV